MRLRKSIENNPLVFLVSRFLKYSKGNEKKVLLYIILSIVAHSILIIAPLIIANVLNTIQLNGITQENYIFIILSLFVFVLVEVGFWIFHWPSRVIERKNAFVVRANYKDYILKNMMFLPLAWHNEHHSGDITDKINKSSQALFLFASDTFTIIGAITSLIASIIMLAYFHLPSVLVILPICFVAILISLKFDSKLIKQYSFINVSENHISEKMVDALSNINSVIILRIEKAVRKTIMGTIFFPRQTYEKNVKLNETKWAVISIIGSSMVFFVIASYILMSVFSGVVLIGTIYVLYEYSQRIRSVFYQFTLRYGILTQQMTELKNIDPVINAFEKRKKIKKYKMDNWKKIVIKNIDFSYSKEEGKKNLHHVSLEINNGEKIALVGESGSGKSTILKLIRSLYYPKKGEVFVDDDYLKNFFKNISYKISLIPQDPEIFKNTIKYNITLGARYRKTHIDEFCKLARFSEILRRLPNGYDTVVGEKGAKLSGGEKQRLALARGLLASERKELILLDEPTSSIDAKNENLIYKGIFKVFNDKTIVSTVHRLHLLEMFDKIVFFEDGKIVTVGTLEEVLTNKKFKSVWQKNKSKL